MLKPWEVNDGRYVDDMVLIHEDKECLLHCKDEITKFLQQELHLKLSPKKQYLQPSGHGMKFLGTDIKCGHINLSSRVIHNFSNKVRKVNQLVEDHKPNHKELKKIESSLNSYLGRGKHYSTFRMNSAFVNKLDRRLFKHRNSLKLLYNLGESKAKVGIKFTDEVCINTFGGNLLGR